MSSISATTLARTGVGTGRFTLALFCLTRPVQKRLRDVATQTVWRLAERLEVDLKKVIDAFGQLHENRHSAAYNVARMSRTDVINTLADGICHRTTNNTRYREPPIMNGGIAFPEMSCGQLSRTRRADHWR